MPLPLTSEELAYAAGIIDGEGCIRLNTQNGRPTLRVQVTNTKSELIVLFHKWFGGYVWINRKKGSSAKDSYVWEQAARQGAEVLVQVLPYLRLKRRQAEIVLEVQAMKTGKRRTPETIAIEQAALTAIRLLNKKGAA